MVSMLGPKRSSRLERKDLEKVILGKTNKAIFNRLTPMNKHALKNKSIKAEVVGGNLCIVESTVGTFYAPKFSGKIVFLEDIDERGYALERSLEHLRSAGVFKGVKAVVLGDFVGGEERNGRDLTLTALKRFAENSPFPVVRGLKSGHGATVRTLPFNTHAELFLGKRATLVVDTGGTF
jgi:muramoyltetrapeptide carboxypeptidase